MKPPIHANRRRDDFRRASISVSDEKALRDRIAELERELNRPETADFLRGIPLEAAHQRLRWGSDHDAGKNPLDWFWLIGYLAQKAAFAVIAGDIDKALHHTISTAAALANWHLRLAGADNSMRPGIEPLHTVTASNKDQNQVVAAHITKFNRGATGHGVDDPLHTITAAHSETRPGGAAPIGVVAAHMMTMRNADAPCSPADAPMRTVTAGGAGETIVAAFMAQNNYSEPGHAMTEPVSTIVNKGSTQALVAANLLRQFGTGVGSSLNEPTRTVMADGQGKTQLAAAFLQKYYKSDQDPDIAEPLHTATVKARFGVAEALLALPPFAPEHHARARQVADLLRAHGLWDDREFVTVDICGVICVIVDLGMRMLIPRELFRAQGFPDSYVIDRKPDGSPITKTEQVSKCGNSVCPPIAAALVRANYEPREAEPVPVMEAAE